MKIKLLEAQTAPSGAQVAVGTIAIEDLKRVFTVDVFAKERGRAGEGGYQRKPKPYRINSIAQKVSDEDYYIPVSLVFNNRDPKAKIKFVDGVAEVDVEDLYCLDGQNRSLAYLQVFDKPEIYGIDQEKFGKRKLNIVLFWGSPLEEEVRQFFDINHFAKAVPAGNKIEIEAYLGEGEPITKVLVDLTWELENSPLWKGVIIYPNSEHGILANNGLVTSLRAISKDSTMARFQDLESLKKLMDAVWGGISLLFPDAFKDKKSFSLQRAIGVNTIHSQIPQIISDIQARNGEIFDRNKIVDIFDKQTWFEYFQPLAEFEDINKDGETVVGVNVWKRGAEGALSKYSSGAGRKILNAAISRELGFLNE